MIISARSLKWASCGSTCFKKTRYITIKYQAYPKISIVVLVLMEEMLRSPVEVGSLSHCLWCFIYPSWLTGFLPSTVFYLLEGCPMSLSFIFSLCSGSLQKECFSTFNGPVCLYPPFRFNNTTIAAAATATATATTTTTTTTTTTATTATTTTTNKHRHQR